MRFSKYGIVASLLFVLGAVWILLYQFDNVWGNLEASYLSFVPSYAVSHVVIHRKIDRLHNSIKENNKNDN